MFTRVLALLIDQCRRSQGNCRRRHNWPAARRRWCLCEIGAGFGACRQPEGRL